MRYFVLVAVGVASWFYPLRMYGAEHVCASNTIPISTRILVVNAANGDQTECTIIGTGPFVYGRILDVSPSVRDALHFSGVTFVHIYIARKTRHHAISH